MQCIRRYLIIFLSISSLVRADIFNVKIVTDKPLNVIDEKFLSFTIDPKYLFADNERYKSKEFLCMASSLTPAYIRIAGPSTSHLAFHNTTVTIDPSTSLEEEKTPKKFSLNNFNEKPVTNTDDLTPKSKETNGSHEIKSNNSEESSPDILRSKVFKKPDNLQFSQEISKGQMGLDSEESSPEIVNNKKPNTDYKKIGRLVKKAESEELSQEFTRFKRASELSSLGVSHGQWRKFVEWANSTGFDLVFALNYDEKSGNGMWDPNAALNILTVADNADVENIFWQLGYECNNRSIEEYVNDLETLKVIADTFPRAGWGVLGGDVTGCLHHESKSDFKDYLILISEKMDAVLLNGNSSSRELERLSPIERQKLLHTLSRSAAPLWLTESTAGVGSGSESPAMDRAADWISSLGYSARNGFSINYRELLEEEMFRPSLSFYMALLFKNLVGTRVLDVDLESPHTVLFAHCTLLRHKAIPGAVTLYGANMDDEPARLSLKLSDKEEGGDVLQFILSVDVSGNIVVNGRAMHHAGDLRPVVKRVRPYKTLLVNLPAKSFGFWVLANTNVTACRDTDVKNNEEDNTNTVKVKRTLGDLTPAEMAKDPETDDPGMEELLKRIENVNVELRDIHEIFQARNSGIKGTILNRRKRQGFEGIDEKIKKIRQKERKIFRQRLDQDLESKPKLFKRLRNLYSKLNSTKIQGNEKVLDAKRRFRHGHVIRNNKRIFKVKPKPAESLDEVHSRRKRSVVNTTKRVWDNEINDDSEESLKMKQLLHKIHEKLKELPNQFMEKDDSEDYTENEDIIVKTKVSKEGTTINLNDKADRGLIKSTIEKLFSILGDLNNNLNRVLNTLPILD